MLRSSWPWIGGAPETAEDPPVCPRCGEPAEGNVVCYGCHARLEEYEQLPLRSEWLLAAQQADGAKQVPAPPAEPLSVALNPIGLVIAIAGAALTILGLFLPANENPGFSGIESNSLIQHGLVTWTVVIFGTLFVIGLLVAYRQRRGVSWAALILPVVAGGSAATLLKGATLYPVVNGQPNTSLPGVQAGAGIGVYVVIAGAVVSAIGVVVMRVSPQSHARRCPDCAETVRADARVCKHCGYRFAEPDATPVGS